MAKHYLVLLLLFAKVAPLQAEEASRADLSRQFEQQIVPWIEQNCVACHDAKTREGDLDLTLFRVLEDVSSAHRVWETVLERVTAAEMPPADAPQQLSQKDRAVLGKWIGEFLHFEAVRNAGDPGLVPARRLSNAEYDATVRDLTGVDIRPTRTFPVDPANTAGFDNSGESLVMSPALMSKYLEASRWIVDHMLLTPAGIRFASHPVVTDTDRDKYCVKRIVEFYYRQPTDYADYFFAAWRYRHRAALGESSLKLVEVAERQRVSPKYLASVWKLLNEDVALLGPLAKLQAMWQTLADFRQEAGARVACEGMRDYVLEARRHFSATFEDLEISGVHKGTQAFVLWKNKQYAAQRRTANFGFLEDQGNSADDSLAQQLLLPPDAESRDQFEAACRKFCSVFPDDFYVSERGRDYLGKPREEQEKGRLLSAGFHSMMGYFRDDRPLMELILDESGQRELDNLWQELDFIAAAPQRQYQGFLWFDRTDSRFMRDAEFDFARPEDKAALSEPVIRRLAEVYLAKAIAAGGDEVPLQAIRDYFVEINQQIRWVEQARIAAEPRQLEAVIELATRAHRRPLNGAEADELVAFYRRLREQDGLSHEQAIQDTVVSILMSPKFCYRVDLLCASEQPRPLDDFELASRLSYFFWSSMPDAELLRHARDGDLRVPDVLKAQALRMLGDQRTRGLATEFGGNWLDFRRFEELNSVDRERFVSFDDELRAAMFEEPIRFILDVVQHDRSILDFIGSERTFVNAALAEHYGLDGLDLAADEWREIEHANDYGRGGLLPMAVFLTKNAPGLRTSPVKRGYWVVRRLLGERIPPPPPNVPELPTDESLLGDLSLRETLAKHREHASCAGCHNKIDAIGLVFEGYGPIGDRRQVDLGGRPVDTRAEFPDGTYRNGVEELRDYLLEQRAQEFIGNFNRKLLSYALGRSLQLSDEMLLQEMSDKLNAHGFRFGQLIESIVLSPQFLNKRGRENGPKQ